VKEILEKVTSSDVFKKWKKEDNYLASFFFMNEWSVDFYSPKTKKITSFLVKESGIEKNKEEKAFQKEEKNVEELKLDEIKISLDEAKKIINKIKKEKAPQEDLTKEIIILQKKKTPIWNMTYITSSFNVLNIKINAINKEVLETKFEPIFSMKKTT